MKYFFISKYADSIGIVPHIEAEGHEVVFYIHEKSPLYSQIGDGLVKKVSSISEGVKDADYIIFDTTGFGSLADRLKQAGKKVWGGCAFADKLEHDRMFAVEFVKELGILVPRTLEFSDKQDAIKQLIHEEPKWILKTNLDICSLTFIPESNEYLAKFIEMTPDLNNTKIILQEYVDGIEVSTNIFYVNGRKIPNPDWTLETKRFLPHDLGMNTGCMTSLVGVYPIAEPRLYQKTLKKCEYMFEKMLLNTCVDINTIIDKNGNPYFLEFTPRLGYNWLYAYLPTLDISPAEFFAKLCEGTLTEIPVRHKVGACIRISVPPYPLELDTRDDKIIQKYFRYPVLVSDFEKVYLVGVKKQDETLVVCNPIVAEVSEVGENWRTVLQQCYMNTTYVEVANKQIRTDAIRNADWRIKNLINMRYFEPSWVS